MALLGAMFWRPVWDRILRGDIDFQSFYISGQLVLRGQLYDTHAFEAAQRALVGHSNAGNLASRPPFFALAFWPLGHLPYRLAWPVWLATLHAALAAFVWLWPGRRGAALACCWSAGVSACLLNGQDSIFFLVWLAMALRFRQRHPFLAGMALAFCAAKYHLFVFLPLLLWRWRFFRGFAAGAAGLAAISFAAGGRDWPRQYAAGLGQKALHPRTEIMPNLHGTFELWPHAGAWELAAGLLVAATVITLIWRADFGRGLAGVLIGGLLVSHHAYLQDCVLLLPALLIELPSARGWGRTLAVWLLTPASAFALIWGHPAGDLMRLAMVGLLAWMVWDTVRKTQSVTIGDARRDRLIVHPSISPAASPLQVPDANLG